MVSDFEAYGEEADGGVGAVVVTATWLLQDDEGYWTGPWNAWCDDQNHCRATVTLTGHGAYVGVYAVLTEGPGEDGDGTTTGAILAGEMPPVPEAPELPAD